MELLEMYTEYIYGPRQEGEKVEMSVQDIRELFPRFFNEGDEVCGKFLSQDRVSNDFVLRNRVLDRSLNKSSVAQQALVYRPNFVPNAPELVWAICQCLKIQKPVFSGFSRCSSMNSISQYVAVGVVNGKIVIRTDIMDNRPYSDVGLVTIQRF